MKLLIIKPGRNELWGAPSWFEERLVAQFPQLEILHLKNYDAVEENLVEAEIALTWLLKPEQFKAAKKLRWIHSPAAGVHQLMFPELVNSDVILTNGREVHGPVVAEHVIALIFALAKGLPFAVRFQLQHTWAQELLWTGAGRPRQLAGATLGLVGLGSIGREVAKSATALGMNVIAVREHSQRANPEGIRQVFASHQMEDFLSRSDYVVLAAPVTSATRGLINAERISKMKSSAFLINVGRGSLIDEAALIIALREKRIAGAALDVFEREPLPADSPLWDLENVLITPHTAGLSEKTWDRQYELFSENLRRYLHKEPLLDLVDKRQGY
jgi:phosphoglycerate dehydrogenase-like enzyme